MNKKLSPLCSLLFFCVFFVISGGVNADAAQDEARLNKIKQNIDALKKELQQTQGHRDELMTTLEKSEKAIGDLSKQAEKLKKELDSTKTKLNKLRDERSQLNSEKRSQQGLVSGYINSAYRLGQQSGVRLLLNQQNPATVARNIKYHDYFIAARAEKIASFVATINRLNEIEPEIALQTERLNKQVKSLDQQKKSMSDAQQSRKKTLLSINRALASKKDSLKTMEADRSRLQRVLTKVTQWVGDLDLPPNDKPFASSRGLLPWPAKGKVIENFGSSRVANKLRWEGLLIQSPPGSPVYSIHHGRVVFSDYLRGHGLLIIVDHGGGYMSLYAHNQALYKELGEWVDSGDVIAAVGNSGGRSESALYFELRRGGKPTNPRGWFRSA